MAEAVVMHVRFRVTGIGPDVTGGGLLESLKHDLMLDSVALVWGSLRRRVDGTQEAEFDLPDEEANLLRGPLSETTVRINGQSMRLKFDEMFEEEEDDVGPDSAVDSARRGDNQAASNGLLAQSRQPIQGPPVLHEERQYTIRPAKHTNCCSRWTSPATGTSGAKESCSVQ